MRNLNDLFKLKSLTAQEKMKNIMHYDIILKNMDHLIKE